MWSLKQTDEDSGRVLKVVLLREDRVATYSEVLDGLIADTSVVDLVDSCIRDAPFSAVRLESPAVSAASLSCSFEFVLIDSPGLSSAPDANAFSQHFSAAVDDVCVFSNLGGDAILVVPNPVAGKEAYIHLSAFSRRAPISQRRAFWRTVGTTSSNRIGRSSVWLSTAGGGVSWLHFRIDDRPKYYHHVPYKRPAAEQVVPADVPTASRSPRG